jgi:demethylsterigmatocystin 6-O-methyltransferase
VKHLQVAAARIGVDLGIFEALHESKEPLSVAALAEKTGAAPELLGMKISRLEITKN